MTNAITAGADPAALDALADRFRDVRVRMGDAQKAIDRSVGTSPWRGADADRFRQRWASEYRRAINGARKFLETHEIELRNNAEEQRRVSMVGRYGDGPKLTELCKLNSSFNDFLAEVARAIGGLGVAVGLAELTDMKGLLSEIGPSVLSGLSLATFLISLGLPDGSIEKLIAEGTDKSLKIGSAVWNFVKGVSRTGSLLKIAPVFTIAGGVLGFVNDYDKILSGKGSLTANELSMSANGMAIVGGTLMLIPCPPVQAVGLGVVAAGAVTGGVSWAVDNLPAIEHFASQAMNETADFAGEALKVVENPIGAAANLLKGWI